MVLKSESIEKGNLFSLNSVFTEHKNQKIKIEFSMHKLNTILD